MNLALGQVIQDPYVIVMKNRMVVGGEAAISPLATMQRHDTVSV